MKKLILILLTAFIAVSCSDNLEQLNENIKDPSSVSGESLFASAQKQLTDLMTTPNVNFNNTKLWAQYWQETTYTDESNYDQKGRNIPDNHWSELYKDVLKDLDEASKVIADTDNTLTNDLKANKLVIIEILNIYAYSNLVETFGDVAYSEALSVENLLPKYDDGITVYKDLIERLTAAINNIDTGEGSFGAGVDLIYSGNAENWKKFANSLKLRMGILLSDVDATLAQSTVQSAIASGVLASNADNANYSYSASSPNTHPVHTNLVLSGRQDYVAAVTIIDMMNTLNDPRRPLFFLEVSGGGYVGGEIGATSGYSTHSHVSAQVEKATANGVLFDYAEVEFLLAEASARNFADPGNAKSHYDGGITSSIMNWGGTSDEAVTYLAQASVDYDLAIASSTASIPWKEVIGNQKWLGLYNRGIEAWTSIRLLDYPNLATPAEPESGFPTRYTYPVIEQTLNGASYSAASSAIGGDEPETKLFWDKF